MRAGIDAHVIGTRAGGNETYMRALLHALAAHAGDEAEWSALVSREEHERADVPLPTVPLRSRSPYTRMLIEVPRLARALGLDVLHVQYTAPLRCPCPCVVSLHDLVAFHWPETMPFAHRHRLRLMTGGTVRRAARLFVLTEAVRDDIAARYGVPPERFDLVQPPVPDAFRPMPDGEALNEVRAKYGLPEKFVLYTGLIQPRKNLVRLARAFQSLVRAGCEHTLVLAGPRAWLDEAVLRELDALNLGDRLIRTGYVDQADLPALYNAADAFAYVSLYEGFGIPVLEALACGTPVLASTDPALVEVAGGAALHADPLDVDALADGLTRVLTDAAYRTRAQSAGPARAATFIPARMAHAALAGYRAAADG